MRQRWELCDDFIEFVFAQCEQHGYSLDASVKRTGYFEDNAHLPNDGTLE